MLKAAIATVLLLGLTMTSAEARRMKHPANLPVCGNLMDPNPCQQYNPNFLQGVRSIKVRMKRVSYRKHYHKRHHYAKKAKPAAPKIALRQHFPQQQFNFVKPVVEAVIVKPIKATLAMVSGIVEPLALKAQEIHDACGSKIISGVRHSYVAGTRLISLHASGRAVDMAGNPKCIYEKLKGWPGGYSTDYHRVAHVHISYGGREHGARFVHGGRTRYARNYARHRYAQRRHYRSHYAAVHRRHHHGGTYANAAF